jgi:hypothetical protein
MIRAALQRFVALQLLPDRRDDAVDGIDERAIESLLTIGSRWVAPGASGRLLVARPAASSILHSSRGCLGLITQAGWAGGNIGENANAPSASPASRWLVFSGGEQVQSRDQGHLSSKSKLAGALAEGANPWPTRSHLSDRCPMQCVRYADSGARVGPTPTVRVPHVQRVQLHCDRRGASTLAG